MQIFLFSIFLCNAAFTLAHPIGDGKKSKRKRNGQFVVWTERPKKVARHRLSPVLSIHSMCADSTMISQIRTSEPVDVPISQGCQNVLKKVVALIPEMGR